METPLPPSSSISETDFLIFRKLCNPAKVDFSQAPGTVPKLSPLPATVAAAPKTPNHGPGTFSKALAAKNTAPRTPAALPPPPPAFPTTPSAPVPPPMPTPKASAPKTPKTPEVDSKALEMQRRHIGLLHLEHMKRVRGVKLTREFTMADESESIQFEIDFQENIESTANAVGMMKMGIGMGFTGVELANDKFGPFLNLAGLSTTACQDMDRFSQPLEQVYRKYWRKKAQNPLFQVISLFVMSIFATHIVNKGGPLAQVLLNIFWPQKRTKPGAEVFNEFSNRGFDASIPMPAPVPPTPAPKPVVPPTPGSRRTMKGPSYLIQAQAANAAPQLPPPPPAPAPAPKPVATAAPPVFPLAGTPVRGGRLSEPPIMSLPTVVEEEPVADLDRATFERLMEEVSNQEVEVA